MGGYDYKTSYTVDITYEYKTGRAEIYVNGELAAHSIKKWIDLQVEKPQPTHVNQECGVGGYETDLHTSELSEFIATSTYPKCHTECLTHSECTAIQWHKHTKECKLVKRCSGQPAHWHMEKNHNCARPAGGWKLDRNYKHWRTSVPLRKCQQRCDEWGDCKAVRWTGLDPGVGIANGKCWLYKTCKSSGTFANVWIKDFKYKKSFAKLGGHLFPKDDWNVRILPSQFSPGADKMYLLTGGSDEETLEYEVAKDFKLERLEVRQWNPFSAHNKKGATKRTHEPYHLGGCMMIKNNDADHNKIET